MNGDAVASRERFGDRAARVAALYEAHASDAGRLAYLLTGDPHLAQDLTHEAFVALIGRLGAIRDDAAIGAYLRRSVVNLARKHWRKRRGEQTYLQSTRPGEPATGGAILAAAERDELWVALARLPYRQRAAIVLRFYEDLSEDETARALGCARGTVKSAVARGLKRMREELDDGRAS